MTRIVTTHYRYKRPPRKRKPVAIEAPAIVTAKSSRRPNLEAKAAAEVQRAPVPGGGGNAAKHTARGNTSYFSAASLRFARQR